MTATATAHTLMVSLRDTKPPVWRPCPPEDCGGPGGFDELMGALAGKDHPGHEMYREWMEQIGEADYDTAHFDRDEINEVLKSDVTTRKGVR